MATYKTPEELRAWSRSFYNKSKVIKRYRCNYIDPDEEKRKAEAEASVSDNTETAYGEAFEDNSASDLANSIISIGNASSVHIDELLSLDSSEIDEMNKKFPSTKEQMSNVKKESKLRKKST